MNFFIRTQFCLKPQNVEKDGKGFKNDRSFNSLSYILMNRIVIRVEYQKTTAGDVLENRNAYKVEYTILTREVNCKRQELKILSSQGMLQHWKTQRVSTLYVEAAQGECSPEGRTPSSNVIYTYLQVIKITNQDLPMTSWTVICFGITCKIARQSCLEFI